MTTEKNPEFECIKCKKSFILLGIFEINKKYLMWCPYCGVILIPGEEKND